MNTVTIIMAIVAGSATVLGAYCAKMLTEWAKKNIAPLVALAAGIILGTAVLELLPEAIELSPTWSYWLLGGFLLFFILEKFVVAHACTAHKKQKHEHTSAKTAVLGIGLHSLVDGLLIGLGFEVSATVGIIATLAVVIHEFPEGIFSYTLLAHSGVGEKRALYYSWLIALATPIGAIVTLLLVNHWSGSTIGSLLALTAGNFFYIATVDLIPETNKASALSSILLVIVGIMSVYILKTVL